MIDEDISVAQVERLRHAVEVDPDLGPDRASRKGRIERIDDVFRVGEERAGNPMVADGLAYKVVADSHLLLWPPQSNGDGGCSAPSTAAVPRPCVTWRTREGDGGQLQSRFVIAVALGGLSEGGEHVCMSPRVIVEHMGESEHIVGCQ